LDKHFSAFNPLTTAIGRPFFDHKSPAARARELFKPSTDSASVLVDIEKKIFVFGLAFAGGNVTGGGVFAFFWPPLPGPGPQPIDPFFWLSFFWKLGKNLRR